MEKNKEGLYPCPVCGNPDVEIRKRELKTLMKEDDREIYEIIYGVECPLWACEKIYAEYYTDKETAIRKWNMIPRQGIKVRTMEYISKDDITALIESYKDRIALNIPEILRDINELDTKTIGGQNNE